MGSNYPEQCSSVIHAFNPMPRYYSEKSRGVKEMCRLTGLKLKCDCTFEGLCISPFIYGLIPITYTLFFQWDAQIVAG